MKAIGPLILAKWFFTRIVITLFFSETKTSCIKVRMQERLILNGLPLAVLMTRFKQLKSLEVILL